ncbi:hypothetical protein Zmor_001360 [Zophobas morio]|uniref:SCP domain-containing protein n=1 Tax=Zophobas morio TaxID=2755281 RepID=A0AA38J2K7_9CUCU|nr:hypothetical protein Zmor_001360 [Zophobas morio]
MSSLSIITIQPLLAFLTHLLVIRGTYSHCDKRLIHTGVSEEEKQSILDAHNKMRQRVALGQINGQPQASDMMTMTWDNVLAAQAQNWATACTYTVHDSHRHLEAYFVGQNIATRWTTRSPRSFHDAKPSWTKDAMSPWFSEHQMYNFEPFTHTPASHYTQLIWAKTTLVGCGYAFYEERQRFTKKYVCNYGPSGNVIVPLENILDYAKNQEPTIIENMEVIIFSTLNLTKNAMGIAVAIIIMFSDTFISEITLLLRSLENLRGIDCERHLERNAGTVKALIPRFLSTK